MFRGTLLSGAAVVFALVCGSARADDTVVYTPDFFEQFAPQTAGDMVERIPGFTIRGGEGGGRGFGQASLNILINGRRPSSKSLGADAILDRISVERVERIEVLDGTSLDIMGLTGDVANIVTVAFGLTGNWEAAARFEEGTQPQWPEIEATATVSRGDVTLTGSVDLGLFTRSEDGVEEFRDAPGTSFEDRRERIVTERQNPEVDFALNWKPPSGNELNVTGQLSRGNFNQDLVEDFVAVGPAGDTGQSIFFSGEDEIEFELGADYSFNAGPSDWDGQLKLIGLYRFEDSEFTSRFADFTVGRDAFTQEFLQDIEETEIIGRAEYTFLGGAWQVSGEYAFNALEALNTLDGDDFPLTRVTEDRAQGLVSHNRKLGAWDVQASVGAEFSEISVPTAAGAPSDSFVRPKGSVSASRKLDAKHSLILQAEREVGQLNFFDFVDEIDLEEGRDDAGNAGIVPDQTWVLEATLERTDPKGLSGRINPRFAIISDPIDRVRFADGTEGPGNLDSNAFFYGVRGNLTWVLDDVVTQGLRLDASGSIFETDIEDPLTGERRRFNSTALWNARAELRYDIPNTPWGLEVSGSRIASGIQFFRFDDVIEQDFEDFVVDAEVEHKAFFGMNLRVRLQNILDEEITRERLLFAPDRLGVLTGSEFRSRTRGRRLSVILSDTF